MRASRFSLIFCLLWCGLLAPGTAAARDPFFPDAGNQGYDAQQYEVRLFYLSGDGGVVASTRVSAESRDRLRRFSLDFFGPRVTAVEVNGERAGFSRSQGKLEVRAPEPIGAQQRFSVTVHYRGVPPRITDPDGTPEGWYRTDDGVIAVGEPQGTAAWIPCNNVPLDKAAFLFEVSVPAELRAVANGRLGRVERAGGRATYRWREANPMSPFLAVLNIGRGRIARGRIGNLPTWTLIDPRLERGSVRALAALPEVVRFQSRLFGGYPFGAAGSIVDYAPELGYALETQSRPIYAFVPDLTTIVHETAHQWFGDSVGIQRWPQIWLAEGFATWTEWYYAERHGGRTARGIFERLHRVPAVNEAFWNPPPARPGTAKNLFDPPVYVRGAMALQALRQQIGTRPMLALLRRWTVGHRHGNATIPEFTDLAEEVAGRDLDKLFQRWLYQPGKP